jgi:predicted 3-demethylubiquinone-9 3-methyltransferase (glyoxalase superfamily)
LAKEETIMTEQKVTPCLWFDFNAEEAVAHYLAIFSKSRIVSKTHYGEAGPGPAGAVMTILFEIDGQQVLALNGGPQFKFTPALSLIVNCDDQAEIDRLWEKLAEGGAPGQCGWLTDKFGVSWQIAPRALPSLLTSQDAKAADRLMRAVLTMKKLDIAQMQQAFAPN